jgi:hypothetical protein
VADAETTRSKLPIELSSIVTSLESVTRELIKKLSREEAVAVVAELCERLRTMADDQRGPDRPFSR